MVYEERRSRGLPAALPAAPPVWRPHGRRGGLAEPYDITVHHSAAAKQPILDDYPTVLSYSDHGL